MASRAQIVSFHCTLKNKMGEVISSTFNRDIVTHAEDAPPDGDLLQGLVEGLKNIRAGEHRKIFVPAEKAYGYYDPKLVIEVSKKRLPKEEICAVGNQILSQEDDGAPRWYRIVDVGNRTVTLDGNHPLAGQDLIFEIQAISAREATQDELNEASDRPSETGFLH